ncbi:MAG: MFS transporter [Chloroflexi bacterium]|nr:MFS transporter [Chloroflexota bacterium]
MRGVGRGGSLMRLLLGRASMERRIVVSASLAHGMTHTLELTFAALLVRVGFEFGVDVAVLGAVANAGTFTFGAAALPAGWLVDRYGPRAVVVASMWVAAAFALLVALAPTLLLLAAALTLLGAGIGLYHPAGTSIVASLSHRRGIAFAAHGVAGNVGVALAPVAAVGIALLFDWRIAYAAFALGALAVGALVLRIAPSREEARAAATAAASHASVHAPGAHARTSPPSPRRWLSAALLLIYVGTIAQGFVYRGSLTFLTLHLKEHLGIGVLGWSAEAVAGAAATLVLLAAVFGQFAGGALSDRIPVERALLPFAALLGPALVLVGSMSGVALLLACAAFVAVNFALQPIFNGLVSDYSPAGSPGRAFGLMFFLTFGVGSFAASFAGLLAARWGTPAVFFALGAISLGMLAAMSVVAAGAERRRTRAERGAEAEAAHAKELVVGD